MNLNGPAYARFDNEEHALIRNKKPVARAIYHADMAEQCLADTDKGTYVGGMPTNAVVGQVHATLAVAWATIAATQETLRA